MAWWRRIFARESQDDSEPAPLRFPQVPAYHEVVFEELAVRVSAHDCFVGPHSIPCWSYVTDGMRRHGQKEFVFTLKRREGEAPEDYPRDPLRLFHSIYGLAAQGKKVEAGEFTQFRLPDGFLGIDGVVAVAYCKGEKLAGVNYPEAPLAAILFLPEEAELLPNIGSYRVLSRLAHENRYFPTPPWSDRDRQPVLNRDELSRSVLAELPIAYVPWGTVKMAIAEPANPEDIGSDPLAGQGDDRLGLRISYMAVPQMSELLAQIPNDRGFALVMPPASDSDSRLVWLAETNSIEAIVPPNSSGTVQTGCFLAIRPTAEEAEGGQICEDGFAVWMNRETLIKFREALQRGERLEIPGNGDRCRFSLTWEMPEKPAIAIEFGNGIFYQPEEVLQHRLGDRDEFVRYIGSLQQILRRFFEQLPPGKGQNLLFVSAIRPGPRARFWFDFDPDLFAHGLREDLLRRLYEVPLPNIRGGDVVCALNGKLWGGNPVENPQPRMIPEQWRRAAVSLGAVKGQLQIDDILQAVWPLENHGK